MKPAVPRDAASVRTGKSRDPGDLVKAEGMATPAVSPVSPSEGRASGGSTVGRHVYRVGGLRIPVKNSVRGPKSRCAGRVKDLLRRRAEAPVAGRCDPTAIEPPARKPPAPRDRPAFRGFVSPSHSLRPSREKAEADDAEVDFDDED